MNVRDLVAVFDEPPIPQDFWNMKEDLKREMDDLAGQNEIARGGPISGSKTTATEVMKFEEARGQLLGMEQASIMRYLRRSGQIYVSMLQQFYSGRTMVEIVGDMGEKEMVPFTRREAMTRCRLEVVPESMVPMDKQYRRFELMNLLQIITQIPPFAEMLGPEGWRALARALFDAHRLSTITNLLRAPSEATIMQMLQQQGAGQQLLPTTGPEAVLGNVTGEGRGEGGTAAGNIEPMTQGAETLMATPGHIAGRGF